MIRGAPSSHETTKPRKPCRRRGSAAFVAFSCAVALCLSSGVFAQVPASAPAKPAQAQAEPAQDPLGRETPRGTLVGFMRAYAEGNGEAAAAYLNTTLRGTAAADLARQLHAVLDSRLPAQLSQVSDRPEGGLANPLKPDQDVIGTITTNTGPLDIVVERVARGSAGPVWLFSRRTLQAIPDVFDEVDLVRVDRFLPNILTKTRIAGVRLFDWIVLVVLVPLAYQLVGLIGLLIGRLLTVRSVSGHETRQVFPGFVRLLLLSAIIRRLLTAIDLPFIERQFWYITTAMFTIVGFAWLLLVLTAVGERYAQRRFKAAGSRETVAILRLVRRTVDVIIVAAGGLLTLQYFGVNPTAALAGLGIGGIAVALAAQKTLENVIGGLSIILDGAVRVGDSLKLGDIEGKVDSIGLRSTRIRTLDRTLLCVPNSQIANVNIETLSARDKYWFHHFVGLRYETTGEQMHEVLDGVQRLLTTHPVIDQHEPIRVCFCRFGPSSLDIELFAYILQTDRDAFLETQQQLLLAIMEIVEEAGTAIALPSQMLHVADSRKSREPAVAASVPGRRAGAPSR